MTIQREYNEGMKQATLRQQRAVEMVATGRSKAQILRDAGYSEAIVRHPQRVFSSPVVVVLLRESMRDPEREVLEEAAEAQKALFNARRLESMTFPKQVSDDEIRDFIAGTGSVVQKIVHTQRSRRAYYLAPDTVSRASALHMYYKMRGLYALK